MNGSINGSITGCTIQDYSRERSSSNSNLSSDCLAINILTNQIAHIRKLFELSTRLLEQSQSKKLLAVYEDVAFRIRTVLDPEIQELDRGLTDFIGMKYFLSSSVFLVGPVALGMLALSSRHTNSINYLFIHVLCYWQNSFIKFDSYSDIFFFRVFIHLDRGLTLSKFTHSGGLTSLLVHLGKNE